MEYLFSEASNLFLSTPPRIYAVTKANIGITAAFAAITITVLGLGATITAYAIRDGGKTKFLHRETHPRL